MIEDHSYTKSNYNILVVDDELSMREFLLIMLSKQGYKVDTAPDGNSAIIKIEQKSYDLIITDLSMPKGDGMSVLLKTKEISNDTPVILITAYATTENAVEAMKKGAFDYIIKPFKNDELKLIIANALEKRRLIHENKLLRKEVESRYGYGNLVGVSSSMIKIYDMIRQVQDIRVNVLIAGESGTGKEMVAKALHYNGERKNAPFITINCGAIPEALIESELFGHKKGSFTGAVANKIGLFEAAHTGTLFLDEIGDMPLSTQVKVLRALQERSFKAVGGTDDIQVDVRVIAASHKDLELEVKEGRFREDLFYRLNVVQMRIPSLKERREDISLLIEHFLKKFSTEYKKNILSISPDAMRSFLDYSYPGNVRELSNIVERAVALEKTSQIEVTSLPPHILKKEDAIKEQVTVVLPPDGMNLDAVMEHLERTALTQALERTSGKKKQAALLLQISFRSLRYRMKKLGLMEDNSDLDEVD